MIRTGLGYDSHRFADGRPLVLGGVTIPHDRGLAGHSDADALCHAVTDAILGALVAGDIGQRFPDTDPSWTGADSTRFVAEAVRLAGEQGLAVTHCDATVLTEVPKMSPHVSAIRRRLAEILRCDPSAVSVKAKTNEGMGFVGRGEGLAVMAVVTLAPRG